MQLEALMKAGAYQQVRADAGRLLESGDLPVGEQAVVLRMACRAAVCLKDYYAAAKLGERAIEAALEAGDHSSMSRARFYAGVAYTYIGDTHAAEQHLTAFLQDIPVELRTVEGMAYYNLSIVHRLRRDWTGAIQLLNQACTLFEKAGDAAERAQAELDLAWCYSMMGTPTMAGQHLTHVEEYLSQHDNAMLGADLVCARALHARMVGDLLHSSRFCQEILIPGRPGVTAHQLAEACWILGENALDLGRMEEAGAFVHLALTNATEANWPAMMNLAGDLRRRYTARVAAGA